MRKLHLVGLTTDRDGLIFTARKGSKSGGYIVPLDDKVLAAITEARNARNGAPAEGEAAVVDVEAVPRRLRSQSALTPREMQARLRAGRSIEEVAAEAGVDTEWVTRFAVPILAEQAQVVELARALVYAKPRLGESTQPLGASVIQNLSDRGIFLPDDVAKAGWSAFQLHDSVWMVRFRYRARSRDQEAQWEIDVPAGRLLARNRHASDLGYVEPGRRRRDVESEEEPPGNTPAATAAAAAGPPSLPPASAPRRRARRAAVPAVRPPVKAVKAARADTGKSAPAPAKSRARATTNPAATLATPAKTRGKAAPPKRPSRTEAPAAAAATSAKAAARRRPARPAVKAAPTKPAARNRPVKPTPTTARAKSATRSRPVKSPAAAAPARSAPRRRPAKPAPPADVEPTAGSGGVRMAVAQVSTARVAASMASADRAPWAGAVGRRPGARPAPAVADAPEGRRTPSRPSPHDPAGDEPAGVRPFEPRPLPDSGRRPPPPRVRKVTVPRPASSPDDPPAVTLPAPRRPAAQQEPVPVERPKRRRLRSR